MNFNYFCLFGLGSYSDLEIKKTTNLETNLHGLARYANYSIRVLAFTSAGEGVQSKPVFCMTEEDGKLIFIFPQNIFIHYKKFFKSKKC